MQEDWKTLSAQDRESWILTRLETDPVPVDEVLGVLEAVAAQDTEAVDTLMEFFLAEVQDALTLDQELRCTAIQAASKGSDQAFLAAWRDGLAARFEDDRAKKTFLDHIGIDKGLDVLECIRRLRVLLDLSPGRMCHDNTWGFGLVRRIDPFYKKVEIDFDNKRGHEMSFAYAAEALELIDDDHLLARKHRDAAGLQELVKDDPAEVVRIALRSYGPLTSPLLQEVLVPAILPDAGWKKFWDAARRGLKKDPLVDIPAKRSEPITLLAAAFAYDESWFTRLAAERSLDQILARLDEFHAEEDAAGLDDAHRDVIRDRLAFTVKGATRQQTGLVIRALGLAKSLGIDPQTIGADAAAATLMQDDSFLAAVQQLAARDVRGLIEYLAHLEPQALNALLLRLLPTLPVAALGEVIDYLGEQGGEQEVAGIVRGQLARKQASLDLLAWIGRNLDMIEKWSLSSHHSLINEMLTGLELAVGGRVHRALTQLVGLFERQDWLAAMLAPLSGEQRRLFLLRMKDTAAFEEMDRRSVLGRMIKAYPELENEMKSRGAEKSERAPRPSGRFTSDRSHAERRAQLQQISQVEIPKNSKEIAVARSYGDLRENHEFKAAKEMQTILLRRESELQQMLSEVSPTDFTDFPSDRAGMGAGVVLRTANATTEQYFILGEWDRDEELGIISSTTRLAVALEDHVPGDEIRVPGEEGERVVVLAEVKGLPQAVLDWARAPEHVEAAVDAT